MSSSRKRFDDRDYKYTLKLYPDSSDYDYLEVIDLLQKFFSEWAWIKHDKDIKHPSRPDSRRYHKEHSLVRERTGVFRSRTRSIIFPLLKPHIHFYGRNNPHCRISVQQIVRYLHLPYSYNFRPHDIERVYDWQASLMYSVHRNAPDKYQYEPYEVHTNINRFDDIIEQKHSFNEDLVILYELLDEAARTGEPVPYYELVRKLVLRGCSPQFIRSSMVEKISISYHYNRMRITVV